MNLDVTALPHNTADARAALINAPAWTDGIRFDTYPRPYIEELDEWLGATAFGSSAQPGLVLHGPVGLGKTALGVCALRELAVVGFGSMFAWNMATSPRLRAAIAAGEEPAPLAPVTFAGFSYLLATRQAQPAWGEPSWFEQLDRDDVSAIMLDDVGIDRGTPFRESFLLQHLEWSVARPRRALILTLNAGQGEWPSLLGERVADRLIDPRRFLSVGLTGESLR